jgi:hypothetical protein
MCVRKNETSKHVHWILEIDSSARLAAPYTCEATVRASPVAMFRSVRMIVGTV